MKRDRAILKGGEERQSGENQTKDPALMAGGASRGKSMRAMLGGLGLALGVFALPAAAVAADDCPDESITTGCSVAVGSSNEKKLETDSDSDWFEVTDLEEETTYRFRQIGEKTDDTLSLLDPLARLLDSNGELIEKNDDGGANTDAQVTYTTGSTAPTLYWEADQHPDSTSGTYRVTVEKFIKECKGSPDTTCELTAGSSVAGLIDPVDDSDWYQTPNEVQEGDSYAFGLVNSGSLDNVYLELLDPGGNLHIAKEKANEARLTFTATSTEFFYAAASTNGGSTGEFSVAYQAQYPDSCPGNLQNPGNLDYSANYTGCYIDSSSATLPVTINGSVNVERDTDWVKLDNLSASESYKLDLIGDTSGTELPDPLLRVYDASGNELDVDDNGKDPDAQLGFTPPSDGAYYVSAEASPTATTQTGDFSLRVEAYTDDCLANANTGCGVSTIGNSSTGKEIEVSGDVDWFKVGLNKSEPYHFVLNPNDTTVLKDPSLVLYDKSGAKVRSSSRDSNGNLSPVELGFRPASGETGTYFVAAESAEGETGFYDLATGTYTDDYADCDGCGTGSLATGDSEPGTLEVPGDRDWFKVNPEADTEYTLSLTGETFSNTYIRLLKTDGTVIKTQSTTNCTSTTSELVHTANSTGDPFYVEAASCDDEYAGDYTVSATLNTSSDGSLTTSDGSSSGEGGGCTLAGTRGPVDPTLPLLLGLSLAFLLSRGRVRAH